jgi:superfamily II RNA helicase
MAQETNTAARPEPGSNTVAGVSAPAAGHENDGKARDERRTLQKRQLKLMERALNEIGVTEQQRQEIIALQEVHNEKMKESWKRINEARRELSRLQDKGVSMEELDAAIRDVTDAQAEQLQILVRNRMEMERILGKEKNDLLMNEAREVFRAHGRRPGTGMPPRPDGPPIPGEEKSAPPPPKNGHGSGNAAPPTP